jgi:surface antigen
MTTTRLLLTAAAAAVALLVALATGGSRFEPDRAFTKGGGGGGTGAGAPGSGGAAEMGGSQGDGGNDKNGSLAAFVASPIYGRVASKEPPTEEEAGAVVSRLGVPCRTLTQTIDIGGQTVPASGVVCRQPDGTWRLNETQSAQLVPTLAGNEPPALTEGAAPNGRHCGRDGAVSCVASGLPRRVRVAAARSHRPADSAIDRPNR